MTFEEKIKIISKVTGYKEDTIRNTLDGSYKGIPIWTFSHRQMLNIMDEAETIIREDERKNLFTLDQLKKAIKMAQEESWDEGGYLGLTYESEQIIKTITTPAEKGEEG